MKKLSLALAVLMAVLVFAGCGGKGGGGGTRTSAEYKTIIENARDDEYNNSPMFAVITPEDGKEPDFDITDFEAMTDEQIDQIMLFNQHDILFGPFLGFNEADMADYAISISSVVITAYGVAIIVPQEGKHDAVEEQINNFVESQVSAQDGYLPDQYDIAKSAIVKTMPTGEVVLVMCEDAEAVMDKIEAGLKK